MIIQSHLTSRSSSHQAIAQSGLQRQHSAPNLHSRFRHYGALALVYRNKCIGMLPRIFKEKIYVEKGFDSIFEYAAKFAGLSREQVSRALSLHASFCDKPELAVALETGEVSISKLARIAGIATQENQEFLADQAKLLSKSALETLVRDVKYATTTNRNEDTNMLALASTAADTCAPSCAVAEISNPNSLFEPKTDDNSVPGHKHSAASIVNKSPVTLDLSPEVQAKLLSLQNKGLDINAILLELLTRREQEIEEEKEDIALAQAERQDAQKPSRYIPTRIRKIIAKEHGTQCAKTGCTRHAQHIHHTRRYYLDQSHDPRYLAPLCREHHHIAHSIDVQFHEVRRERT